MRDGIDFQFSGEVRRIEVENIQRRLEQGDVVLLTPLGYSPSGELFSVPSVELASECAAQMKAAKLIFWTQGQQVVDARNGKPIQSLQLGQAVRILNRWRLSPEVAGPSGSGSVAQVMRLIERSIHALGRGVRRAHLVPTSKGALLKEMFTREGAGVLISQDVYEGIRQATVDDVIGVEEIIRPLEREGVLIPRSRDQLEKDMDDCFVLTRDSSVIACGMLKKYSETHGEICCLAVHPSSRRAGRGETLLAYLERRAILLGLTHLFILSTRSMVWFEERGFVCSDPTDLPPSRHYDTTRGSKVYIKRLGSQRDVDQEEFLWDLTATT